MTTKQATRDATISKTEALVLMKNMVRISISSICYIRDLFPRDCFKNKPYGNVNIHQLQGAKKEDDGEISVTHPDAFLLTQWLEQGVFHALEQEYLSALVFAIYGKQPVTNEDILLETYEFRATYQGDEKTAKINDVALLSKESVKNQAAKFIRSLTEFAGTLDSLPDSCWITLQLKYYDHTPADYEPEYFRASDGQISSLADRLPLIINIGNIRTPSVDMKLRYAGLESLLFEDLCKVGVQDAVSTGASRAGPSDAVSIFSGTNCSISEELQRMDVSSPYTTQNTPPPGGGASDESAPVTAAEPAEPAEHQETTLASKVKDFILQGNAVSARTCATAFAITEAEARNTLTQLLKEGFLKRKGKGYQMNPSAPPAPPVPAVPAVSSAPAAAIPQQTPSPYLGVNSGAAPPAAPRKSAAKPAYQLQQESQQSIEDIEDSFQDTTTSPHQKKQPLQANKPQPLQLKRSRDEPTAATGNSKTIEQQENHGLAEEALNRSRGEQMRDAISMSQESVLSETGSLSRSNHGGGGRPSKRARKCSVIQDPIYLANLHNVARANRSAEPAE